MPRDLYATTPVAINTVSKKTEAKKVLEVATGNKNKLKEFERILKGYEIIGKDLKMDEIQSMDPVKVIEAKAKKAWELNNYQPILVEDTSLTIMGLDGRPGPFVNDFTNEISMRRLIAEHWLAGKDRQAVAQVILAIFDGEELHTYQGSVSGKIAEKLQGSNGFGWDDFFIPDGSKKTFAQMSDKEKDKYSMRAKALKAFTEKPFDLNYPIYMMPEPYAQELSRVRIGKLNNTKAIKFAFSLECLKGNKINSQFKAEQYQPVRYETNNFYTRFILDSKSSSLGLLFTDIDRKALKQYKNGDPYIWQMGPKRRFLALAQRTEYFLNNQNRKVQEKLKQIENEGIASRSNRRSSTIETALGTNIVGDITKTKALKEIGYKKISSHKAVSRSNISQLGLFNLVGKHARSIYGIGSMPPVSGWRDVLVSSSLAHMPVFTHRNSLNAVDLNNQINLIRSARKLLESLHLNKEMYERAIGNIGAAIGSGNVEEEIEKARKLYNKAGVRLFRIYTINSDPRVIETAKALRTEFGEEIEIFVGQIADKQQALRLIEPDIAADGLVFGHGGGMQCTSAINGMALSTLEDIYNVTTDPRFNDTTIVSEGGIGNAVGGILLMGVDLILCNQKMVRGTIELGDVFFEHKTGTACHPYHGSASSPTMLIESSNPELMEKRLYPSGRVKKVEGGPGYIFYTEKANSMSFFVDEFRHFAARTLADLGVADIDELRQFLIENKQEMFRIISSEASYLSGMHKS